MTKISMDLQPCLLTRAGIGTYVYELAKRLADDSELHFQGNVFNFCGRNDNREIYKKLPCQIKENRIIPYRVFMLCQNALPILYCQVFGRADINLFFNYIVPAGVSGKVITTIHDVAYLRFPETLNKENMQRLNSGMKRSIQRADRIITISDFSKREIMELLNVPEDRVSVVPCAAPPKSASAAFSEVSEKFGINEPYILFVSSIEPRKNIVRLLTAFDVLKKEEKIKHKLVLAGGDGWNNSEIYQTASALDCKEDIIFTGFVSDEEKNALYENAECFVFPSVYEGFGIPPLEAMQRGCPVVCSDAASLPEVAGDAARYVNPYDVNSIAEGIWAVLSDNGLRKQLTDFGYERARFYSWDKSAEKLMKVCKEVL